MPGLSRRRAEPQASAGPEFALARTWADSKHSPARVYQIWRALYKAYGSARRQFPDVDWISLIAILDVIAMAHANSGRVDISCLAEEMGWPRATALRRRTIPAAVVDRRFAERCDDALETTEAVPCRPWRALDARQGCGSTSASPTMN
jgi:hypothetical protein